MEKKFRQIGDEVVEYTAAEYAQVEIDKAEDQKQAEALEVKAADKAALLAKLGITADEAKLLLNQENTMGPVQFNVSNETKYDLRIQASNGAQAGAVAGASTGLSFTPDDTNITCAMRWYADGICILQGSVAWSAGGSGADDGWSTSNLICMNGQANGVGFSGCNEGWVELQPYNLMANGGEVSVTYTNA